MSAPRLPDITNTVPLSRYELGLALRTVAVGSLLALGIFVVSAATDEPDASWSGRLGRISALLPIAGALACALVLGQARSRGEVRALGALGVSPATIARGPWLGAVLVGLLGVLVIAAGLGQVDSLFPHIEEELVWAYGDGAWVERSIGLVVAPSGHIRMEPPKGLASTLEARSLEGATLLALSLTSLVLPAWALAPSLVARRLGVALLAGVVTIASFHLVGAQKIPGLGLLALPLLLLADAAFRGRTAHRGT